jgi:hypothetical protein
VAADGLVPEAWQLEGFQVVIVYDWHAASTEKWVWLQDGVSGQLVATVPGAPRAAASWPIERLARRRRNEIPGALAPPRRWS